VATANTLQMVSRRWLLWLGVAAAASLALAGCAHGESIDEMDEVEEDGSFSEMDLFVEGACSRGMRTHAIGDDDDDHDDDWSGNAEHGSQRSRAIHAQCRPAPAPKERTDVKGAIKAAEKSTSRVHLIDGRSLAHSRWRRACRGLCHSGECVSAGDSAESQECTRVDEPRGAAHESRCACAEQRRRGADVSLQAGAAFDFMRSARPDNKEKTTNIRDELNRALLYLKRSFKITEALTPDEKAAALIRQYIERIRMSTLEVFGDDCPQGRCPEWKKANADPTAEPEDVEGRMQEVIMERRKAKQQEAARSAPPKRRHESAKPAPPPAEEKRRGPRSSGGAAADDPWEEL
jgi:hypothetical protein